VGGMKMFIKMYFVINGHKDWVIFECDDIEDSRKQARAFAEKKGIKLEDCWSERLDKDEE
jgi:hypothetical protein